MNDFFDFIFNNGDFRYSRVDKNITIINGDEHSTLVCNVLGINKENIKVDIDEDYIFINGLTKNELMNKDFYVDYKIRVKPDRIEKIEKKVENGLLVLVVYWKKSNKSNIQIIEK